MALPIIETIIHKDIKINIVHHEHKGYSYSFKGENSGRNISMCAYCMGLWKKTKDDAIEDAKNDIDLAIHGKRHPHPYQRAPIIVRKHTL